MTDVMALLAKDAGDDEDGSQPRTAPVAHSELSDDTTQKIVKVEAVRGDEKDNVPPVNGWQPVALPDVWTERWPNYTGVVWYRFTWRLDASPMPGPDATTGLSPAGFDARPPDAVHAILVSYWSMAGTLYLNGALLERDVSLVEPLSRSWNTPRLVILPDALLRQGDNTILVRISGLALEDPGLGSITTGRLGELRWLYGHDMFFRHDWQLFSVAVSFAVGMFVLALWVMRRQQPIYGWFCLTTIAWMIVGYSQVARSPWPFNSTTQWQTLIMLAVVVHAWSYAMGMIRFADKRLPRAERWLRRIVYLDIGIILALIALPESVLRSGQIISMQLAAAIFLGASLCFVYFAFRYGLTKHRIVAIATLVLVVAGAHDLLTWMNILSDNLYINALTSQVQIVCIGFALANDFVANIRRVERFNEDLQLKVEEVRQGLESTLKRQYELQLANARLNERLNLAHDLHDGLGGTLVSSIALLEQKGELPAERFLPILKELRDDLRIIIDTSSQATASDHGLQAVLIPMRHRWTRLLEAQNIDCHWNITGLASCRLPAGSNLELMRILQESLTNVMKHSGASRVDVTWCAVPHQLILIVQDNGIGFPRNDDSPSFGAGLLSIAKRVRRCEGTVRFDNRDGACVTVIVPCEAEGLVPGL
ncbi:7TM diverse intracellular signaling domain-containing protein [Robbsia andropogonis]|uniref:sensor histidine kinase n=2 Tax=Robbsia andropogonis TaxID=28092 RepID=UPI0006969213|nr:7TM diverse intracellular signaling domain-containing protein [Robbsia andropogonis]